MAVVLSLGWKVLLGALLLFAVAPGFLLRLISAAWPKNDERRKEMRADLEVLPYIQRPFFVASLIEAALFDGLGARVSLRRARRSGRESDGRKVLAKSTIEWVAPNGDLVPVSYDPVEDVMTFTTTTWICFRSSRSAVEASSYSPFSTMGWIFPRGPRSGRQRRRLRRFLTH